MMLANFSEYFESDPVEDNYCRQVQQSYSFVEPQSFSSPELLLLNEALAKELSIQDFDLHEKTQLLAGQLLFEGSKPYALAYGGHQFGNWAGQLGDGRAINLGELLASDGKAITLQLKGAGKTPYSRQGDGLAVLRSSVREYLCSEAMYHLGIKTTRALSLSLTGDQVMRDMFYDGNPELEPGAIVCRTSRSFLRFGSFQLPASRGDKELLKQLLDFAINNYFSHLGEPNKDTYIAWFKEVAEQSCGLVIDWMRVGFVHGVLNTDNMSILSETIDYGPYGWIDNFDLGWTPNTTDAQGKRYAFGAQPEIFQWNLFQLANAVYPLIEEAEPLNQILSDFAIHYETKWQQMMASKCGIVGNGKKQHELFLQLERIMSVDQADMTIFYRLLADMPKQDYIWREHFASCFYQEVSDDSWRHWQDWLKDYSAQVSWQENDIQIRKEAMNMVNPCFVLRNYLTQQANDAAHQGAYS